MERRIFDFDKLIMTSSDNAKINSLLKAFSQSVAKRIKGFVTDTFCFEYVSTKYRSTNDSLLNAITLVFYFEPFGYLFLRIDKNIGYGLIEKLLGGYETEYFLTPDSVSDLDKKLLTLIGLEMIESAKEVFSGLLDNYEIKFKDFILTDLDYYKFVEYVSYKDYWKHPLNITFTAAICEEIGSCNIVMPAITYNPLFNRLRDNRICNAEENESSSNLLDLTNTNAGFQEIVNFKKIAKETDTTQKNREIVPINNSVVNDQNISKVKVDIRDVLSNTEVETLCLLFRNEHPQTIALALICFLDPIKSSMILSSLSDWIQSEVVKRVAMAKRFLSKILIEVENYLVNKLSTLDYRYVDGRETLVKIITLVNKTTESAILKNLEKEYPDLAEEIELKLFNFEDIVLIGDRDVQKILREVDTTELAKALKGVNPEVQDKIFRNMTKRAVTVLKDEMDFMGPVVLKEVENSQKKLVNIIKLLEDAGDITIARNDKDGLVL